MNSLSKSHFLAWAAAVFAPSLVLLPGSLTAVEAHSLRPPASQLLGSLRRSDDAKAVSPNQSSEAIRFTQDADGFLRSLGAPPGHEFPVPAAAESDDAGARARRFLRENAAAFGLLSSALDHQSVRIRRDAQDRQFVRLQQTYAGVPVHGAQTTVQLSPQGGVEFVLPVSARHGAELDQRPGFTTPQLSADAVVALARNHFATASGTNEFLNSPPELRVFAPAVVGVGGSARLVWSFFIADPSATRVNHHALVDAHTGEWVRRTSLNLSALNREISDANNTDSDGELRRFEGQGASGITDVDNAYVMVGDTYNFYTNHHWRDSIDGGGMTIKVTTRYCKSGRPCPYDNAFWQSGWWLWGNRMYFGEGYTTDDIIGHEYTHGVTQSECGLNYENASGAINESFSDVWGEFVDLTNGRGDDSAEVRWLVGEDRGEPFRNMKNPPARNDPDRLGSSLYHFPEADPSDANDYGGVHSNSGINNKLCFLLTDGGTFNGQTISGLGIDRVANLYYEVTARLLNSSSDFHALAAALRQAAANQRWTPAERENLYRACVAVEIDGWYVDWASTCVPSSGTRHCAFQLVGPATALAASGDIINIRTGNYPEAIAINKRLTLRPMDGPVTIGR